MSERQFSLRQLLIVTTASCLVLALPGGWLVLLTLIGWAATMGAIVAVLVAWRRPIYRAVAGAARPTLHRHTIDSSCDL